MKINVMRHNNSSYYTQSLFNGIMTAIRTHRNKGAFDNIKLIGFGIDILCVCVCEGEGGERRRELLYK